MEFLLSGDFSPHIDWRTSYIASVKRENEKMLSFRKTVT